MILYGSSEAKSRVASRWFIDPVLALFQDVMVSLRARSLDSVRNLCKLATRDKCFPPTNLCSAALRLTRPFRILCGNRNLSSVRWRYLKCSEKKCTQDGENPPSNKALSGSRRVFCSSSLGEFWFGASEIWSRLAEDVTVRRGGIVCSICSRLVRFAVVVGTGCESVWSK